MDFGSLLKLTVSIFYYVLVGAMALLSLFAIYILVRYGKTPLISLAVSIVYIIFFLTILGGSFAALQALP